MNNFYKKFLFLFQKKFTFKFLKSSRYLILEHGQEDILLKYVKKNAEFVYFNYEINFYIIWLLILRLKKINQLNYYNLAIEKIKPTKIITATDDSKNFYKLKKIYPDKIFISIQNGYRNVDKIFYHTQKEKKLFKSDVIFCIGKHNISLYNSSINSKVIPIGTIKNNFIKSKNNKEINRLVYISVFRISKILKYSRSDYQSLYDLSFDEFKYFIDSEIKVIESLYEVCKIKKIPFYIVGGSKNSFNEEKAWYKKILKDDSLNIIKKTSFRSSYDFLLKSKYIASIDSTLGYEMLSRNKKIVFFSRNIPISKKQNKLWQFGYPYVKNKRGFFFTNILNTQEAIRLVNNLISCKKNKWVFKIKRIKNNLISYDSGNKKLIKELK